MSHINKLVNSLKKLCRKIQQKQNHNTDNGTNTENCTTYVN